MRHAIAWRCLGQGKREYMYKLIIASSTTLRISATLHKLLPVHPTGHMLRVHIYCGGETNASSYQQWAEFEEQIIYMYST